MYKRRCYFGKEASTTTRVLTALCPIGHSPIHAAIPNSRNLAMRYSCGRSPLTRLQCPHSSCRLSMLSWPPPPIGMMGPPRGGGRGLAAAPVAPALLLAEQHVLVLAVRHWRVDVGLPRDVGNQPCCGTGRPWTAAGEYRPARRPWVRCRRRSNTGPSSQRRSTL